MSRYLDGAASERWAAALENPFHEAFEQSFDETFDESFDEAFDETFEESFEESFDQAFDEHEARSVLHACLPGEGPPRPVPDPSGRGPHPVVGRGTTPARSRNPTVGHAQQLLNRFLARTAAGPVGCVDPSAQRVAYMSSLRAQLRRNGQDPLKVDCRFGPNTEMATRIFQACQGLQRDGVIGPITWRRLHAVVGQRRPGPRSEACPSAAPRRTSQREYEHELEYDHQDEGFEQQAAPGGRNRQPASPAVQPRIVFFQSGTEERDHFARVAGAIANRIHPLQVQGDGESQCGPLRPGPTPYTSGRDIIAKLRRARRCLGRPIEVVHVVGHGRPYGLSANDGRLNGLYRDVARNETGPRVPGHATVSQIPTGLFADNVVFVIHSCRCGRGADSFAAELFARLSGPLRLANAKVFAHPNSQCAGRNCDWKEFSSRLPRGECVASIAPHYFDISTRLCPPSACRFPCRPPARRPVQQPRPQRRPTTPRPRREAFDWYAFEGDDTETFEPEYLEPAGELEDFEPEDFEPEDFEPEDFEGYEGFEPEGEHASCCAACAARR